MSLDALLSQAGIPPEEVLEMLPDNGEPKPTPEEKKAEALKSAAALADLPGMPGFLKPTRTSLAAEAARTEEEEAHPQASGADDGVATATVDATDGNGQGFRVTVMVSPDDETAKEAAALRESAVSSKPEPNVFGSPYGNGSGIDARYYPQNQSAGSGFGGAMQPAPSFDAALGGASLADPYGYGFGVQPSIPLGAANSVSFGAAMPVPGVDAAGVLPSSNANAFGEGGAVMYDLGAAAPAFGAPANGFAPFDPNAQPALDGGFGIPSSGVPLTDEEAAAQAAAAQNAAMIDAMVQFGPDGVPEEEKKRFFGKKKREKEARKAAEEAAAFAAATAAAAEAAAAAEEAARHQPTAYIPTTPPQFGGVSGPEPMEAPLMGADPNAALAGQQMMAPANGAQAPLPAGGMAQPQADMSGYDQLTSAMPQVSGYGVAGAQDPGATTGMPAVGQVPMMGADGSMFFGDGTASAGYGYDAYGYAADGTGMTPEGVAALEAMRTDMNDAANSHKRMVKRVKIAVASVIGVIVLVAAGLGLSIGMGWLDLAALGINLDPSGSAATPTSSSASAGSLSYHSTSSSASSASSASSSSSAADSGSITNNGGGTTASNLAGDEIYHYTLTTIDGEHPAVTEVVTYNSEGICIQTAMDAVFSTATAAQAFVERVRGDYGSNFLSGSVDGTTAHVVVNMERAKLTRQGYEDALRSVVDDLEIEREA